MYNKKGEKMTNGKELEYFWIDGDYGWNQERFKEWSMNLGGCADVTATDSIIYFTKYFGLAGLVPSELARDIALMGENYRSHHLREDEYLQLAYDMKPYLRLRLSGVNKLSIYIDGFRKYLDDRGVEGVSIDGFDGDGSLDEAEKVIASQIDKGILIPSLTLRHRNPMFRDFTWHWYLITGYDKIGNDLLVKLVSYGEYIWVRLRDLWNTGYRDKGGLIIFDIRNEKSQG